MGLSVGTKPHQKESIHLARLHIWLCHRCRMDQPQSESQYSASRSHWPSALWVTELQPSLRGADQQTRQLILTQKHSYIHTFTTHTHTRLYLLASSATFAAWRRRASRHTQQRRQHATNNCHLWVIHAPDELNNEVDERVGDGTASGVQTHRLDVTQQVDYCGIVAYLGLVNFLQHCFLCVKYLPATGTV